MGADVSALDVAQDAFFDQQFSQRDVAGRVAGLCVPVAAARGFHRSTLALHCIQAELVVAQREFGVTSAVSTVFS